MSLNPALGPNLEPAQKRMALATNYLSFTDGDNDFAQQYLPELYEQEVERYGDRTLSAFLRMVGAEMPMTSDQVIWSEQNRLHIAYEGVSRAANVFTVTGNNAVRVNQTRVIADGFTTIKGLVTVSAGQDITVVPYEHANMNATGLGTSGLKMFVMVLSLVW